MSILPPYREPSWAKRNVREARERQQRAIERMKAAFTPCRSTMPYLVGNPMVVGGIREAHLACRKPKDHEGNHAAPDPAQSDKWREWPS